MIVQFCPSKRVLAQANLGAVKAEMPRELAKDKR